jgi:hypothetical protein
MEHRWISRIATRKNVEILSSDVDVLPAIPGHTRDVSLEGMYVETDGGTLRSKTFVRVKLHSKEIGRDGFEIMAFVIRATSQGGGLVFTGPCPKAFYGLLQP